MFLIHWALQKEGVRHSQLSREERLMKTLLTFKLLLYGFILSSLPRTHSVTQRFVAGKMNMVT
jgi:hypothetical protein